MKACVLDAPAHVGERPLRIAEVPTPAPRENEMLVRVEGFRVGEHIGVAWLHRTCGACRFCRAGPRTSRR